MSSSDCTRNIDPLKLVREGTGQDERAPEALSPDFAPINQHEIAHGIVFAQDYAALLRYFDTGNAEAGDWVPFFAKDVSAQLALLAIEDIEAYKSALLTWFDFLNNRDNESQEDALKARLGYLYASLGTLARQLDTVKEGLPTELALKDTLRNLIKNRLTPAFKQLIAYYQGGKSRGLVADEAPDPAVAVLRVDIVGFDTIFAADYLSTDWSGEEDWASYAGDIAADDSVYGLASGSVFEQINHCAGHALFKAVFDEFLKAFARVVSDAAKALDKTLTDYDKHEPHYALFLAFLRLFEYARSASNGLTQRHLDFYYRDILRLKEKSAEPGQVHLLAELAKQTKSREFKAGELYKAGKDSLGQETYFANDRDFVANQAKVATLKTIFLHNNEDEDADASQTFIDDKNLGRVYASPVANSDDGLGAELTSTDLSWHPFSNKVYTNGQLSDIDMPEAELGFAIASHYLSMAEGTRTITVDFALAEALTENLDAMAGISCLLSAKKEWLTVDASDIEAFGAEAGSQQLTLKISLDGATPAIVPYDSGIHAGYNFDTELPILLVKLVHSAGTEFSYLTLQPLNVTEIKLTVGVKGLRTLALSNDFGPVDASKPFQPFGPMPAAGSSLTIGSKEIFQKEIDTLEAAVTWQPEAVAYSAAPEMEVQLLANGTWQSTDPGVSHDLDTSNLVFIGEVDGESVDAVDGAIVDEPDFASDEVYSTSARHGYARLRLSADLGHAAYQAALVAYLAKETTTKPTTVPVAPGVAEFSLSYEASTTLSLDSTEEDAYENRVGRFFHLAPFGTAEQHPYLTQTDGVALLPQFDCDGTQSEAEFYIGVSGLEPPQSLSLLFQAVEGSADPLTVKPDDHIHWSYLSDNQWVAFAENEVEDATDGLIEPGIVTFAVPRDATQDNTVLPSDMLWLRAAVAEKSDSVCRLQLVAAQALKATFSDHDNAPDFAASPLAAGKIGKLDQPDAGVKSISQPYVSFGGRGAEESSAFYTRVAERLRHKDRAIGLWDYEHLILEAFPRIHKVKCLNHTLYKPTDDGLGEYRELAPGNVTIVTIPKQDGQSQRDPLKPYTSLGLLEEIADYIEARASCFAKVHVRNPQFEEVRASFKLRLNAGYSDTSYYTKQLQEAIVRFLSPWAFSEGGSPSFGGRIYKSALIDFVEAQPYVDYVTDFQLFLGSGTVDMAAVEGSTAVSILVSAPAESHVIEALTVDAESVANESCSCKS